MTRPIFLLTDFGLADTYVGVVKAVILGIAPDARIVDLTHDVPPQDVRAGAFALLTATPYLPDDAVVLAVVDPGVGTSRRPIAIQVGERTFVGPDNGLLSWAVRDDLTRATGATNCAPTGSIAVGAEFIAPAIAAPGIAAPAEGRVSAVVLDRPRFWRPTVSATFHGRDLFAPVAAHLARGVPLTEVGSPCDGLQTLPFPTVERIVSPDGRTVRARGEVVHVDRFGNLVTNLTAADLPHEPVIDVDGHPIVGLSPHFQPARGTTGPDGLIALFGSAGLLEIAVPNGSAVAILGVGVGTAVTVAGTVSPSWVRPPSSS